MASTADNSYNNSYNNLHTDRIFMRMALKLAAKGAAFAAPNPMVGSVIVKDGRVIGMGWHHRCGEAHAERNALAACTENPAGATLYVTLEPCCHHGKQPPCTDAILSSGIRRVVVSLADPNPLVAGGGLKILRDAGLDVTCGVLADECARQNRAFLHYITTQTPYVTLKYAMSLDGKIAAYTGESQWITSAPARHHVQINRAHNQAIMVGVGTVLADNPRLTCRLKNQPTPLRIICDTHLRTPLKSTVVQTAAKAPTLIATCVADEAQIAPYLAAGCRVWVLPQAADGHVDLAELMRRLGAEKISSLIVEGGAELSWSMLNAGLVQRVQAYIAPMLLGGAGAKSPLGGLGFPHPNVAIRLTNTEITPIGRDFLIEADVINNPKQEVTPCSQA